MTTEQFLALPSREQDALVAEKVMGIIFCTHPFAERKAKLEEIYPHVESPYIYFDTGHSCCICGKKRAVNVKNYSIDIRAAWEVVEKMNQGRYVMRLETWDLDSEAGCEFSKSTDKEILRYRAVCIKPAPLAICIAALKVVGALED